MVRAILEGRKTQTRRVVRIPLHGDSDTSWVKSIHQDGGGNWIAWSTAAPDVAEFTKKAYPNGEGFRCPYGKAGDRLWVRETFWPRPYRTPRDMREGADTWPKVFYEADNPDADELRGWGWKRKPSIFMPREFSRITLGVTGVRVEQLREISEQDARKEGMLTTGIGARAAFMVGWDAINGKRKGCTWSDNPWVWVVEFKMVSKRAKSEPRNEPRTDAVQFPMASQNELVDRNQRALIDAS